MRGGTPPSPPLTSPSSPPRKSDYDMDISNIFQGDSNDTITSKDSSVISPDITVYDTEDEAEATPPPVCLSPINGQHMAPGVPIQMQVNMKSNINQASNIPLCFMMNARSLYNKQEHFKDLYQLGPDLIFASETWERSGNS